MSTEHEADRAHSRMSPEPRLDVKSLFLDALELSGEARATFLDEHCVNDDVRAQIDALIAANDDAPSFLDEPQGSGEVPGARIGRYKLLQKIGEGGFGIVWMAEQEEPVRRKVALKVLKLGMDTKQVVARFEAERQALALMDHPNIAKVLDGGATENGRPFFVMELVRGVAITQYCDEARVSARSRLQLFVDVCAAIQHAHQKGIIHRDLKPSNVLVTLHDGRPVPMVIDFGIAKATSGSLTEKTLFTEFRQFVGTPQYMSPEQTAISGLDVDTRSDVYSLGVLLYELLTGKTPFDPTTLKVAALDEILRIIREVEPPRPSNRVSTLGEEEIFVASARATEPVALRRMMSGDLDWIVMKAIEKERTRRYESASNLAEDIERYLADEPVVARPPSNVYRLHKFARRNRVAVVAGALVLVAVVAGAGLAFVGFVRASSERDHAVLAEARAQEAAAATTAVNDFFGEMLVSIDPLRLRHRSGFAPAEALAEVTAAGLARDVSVAEMLRRASGEVGSSFAGEPVIEARVRESLGTTLLGLGHPADAAREFEVVHRLRTTADGTDHPDTLRARLLQGAARAALGHAPAAEEILREARAGMRRVHGEEHPRTLHASALLGHVLVLRARYDEGEELLVATLAAQRRVLGNEHRDTIDTLVQLAECHLWQTDGIAAEPFAREAFALARRTLDEDDFVRVEAERILGTTLEFLQDLKGAEALLRSSVSKLQRIAGESHWSTHFAQFHLARSLVGSADVDEREELLRTALAGLARIEDASALSIVVRTDLALALFEREALDEAIDLARTNVEELIELYGREHARTYEAVTFLRDGLRRAGREEQAEEAYRELVRLRTEAFGPDSLRTCSALGSLARFQHSSGKLDEAQATWREIIALRKRLAERPDAGAREFLGYANSMLHPWVPGVRDVASALPWLERASEAPGSPDADRELAELLLELGRRDEAIAAARRYVRGASELLAAGPDSWHSFFLPEMLFAGPFEEVHDAEAGLVFARAAAEAGDADALDLELYGTGLLLTGRDQEAMDVFRERIEFLGAQADEGPFAFNSWIWSIASAPYEELRDPEVLADALERLREASAESPAILNTLGVVLLRVGRYAEAAEVLEASDAKSGARQGERLYDILFLAMCWQHLGRAQEARALLAEAVPLLDDPTLRPLNQLELKRILAEAQEIIDLP